MTAALLLDTETTGLPKSWSAPSTDFANWPRLVEIAWRIVGGDDAAAPKLYRVKPDGFTIPPEATRLHGITTEIAETTGSGLPDVLDQLTAALQGCERIVAHNARFDRKVLEAEFLRCGRAVPWEGHKERWGCTMFSTVKMCALRQPSGRPKFPRLDELYYRLFRERPPEGQHTAGVDVAILERCYVELTRRKVAL